MQKIDWEETHRRVVRLLTTERMPWHYKQLYLKTVHFTGGNYSENTVPVEKFRQHFDDNEHSDACFLGGGYIGLRRWFPRKDQLSLLPPEPVIELQGDCLVSYDTGFEQALRQQHMKDWFGDAVTRDRYERRRRASLAESHVKQFFARTYPEFYRPPNNQGQYSQPAKEDFWLILPSAQCFPVDVKTWSYQDGNGYDIGTARDPGNSILYLWAEWKDDNTTMMCGVSGGRWLKTIGNGHASGLVHIASNYIWSIDAVLVMLNMARAGMSYSEFYQKLEVKRVRDLTAV